MTTLGGTALTLTDIVKQQDPDGKPAKIVEIMEQEHGLLEVLTWMPCNDGNSHQVTIRTGLPSGAWRRYNRGTAPAKGTTAQVRAQTAKREQVSAVDRDLAEKGGKGNVASVRANEAVAHIQGLGNDVATALLYNDERSEPDGPTGIMAHYASVSTATAASAENVIDGGGSDAADSTSILLVGVGPNSISGLFGEGGVAGIQNEDDGLVDIIDSTGVAGATYKGYRERFSMQAGLCVPDWTCGGRIANIDVSAIIADSGDADLVKLMIQLSERVRRRGAKYAWLMNRKVRAHLRLQKLDRGQYGLTFETVAGKPVTMFDGIPVLIEDSILNTEGRVV